MFKCMLLLMLTLLLTSPTIALAGTTKPVLPQTGQTTSYATSDDGALRIGVAWPNSRFTDNNNGTVTDNLTGLVWLKNANCFGANSWTNALISANGLASGACGLTDGSTAGNWRLPNINELESLVDAGRFNPSLPVGHPFSAVQSYYYWSSNSNVYFGIWLVDMTNGLVYSLHEYNYPSYVWPVRGGQ